MSAIAGFALLAAATGAGMVWLVHRATRTEVGDIVHIQSAGEALSFSMEVEVTRASGGKCVIGLGTAADQGGSLVLERHDADDTLQAAWASPGRSAATGADCGHVADVVLTARQLSDIRFAMAGGNPDMAQVQYLPP